MMAAIRAEWTKLRTVRRWVITLAGAVALIVGVGLLASAGGSTDANQYPNFVTGPDGDPVADEFQFVQQRLSGDGTVTARVATQANSVPDAGAGLMLKATLTAGSRYAAVFVTPGRGVRLGANFTTDIAGGNRTAPVWLRLSRSGTAVTAYESTDGTTWTTIGTVHPDLPNDVHIGLFVSSPPKVVVEHSAGSSSVGEFVTVGSATFDNVSLDPTAAATWRPTTVKMNIERSGGMEAPPEKESEPSRTPGDPTDGAEISADGTFRVTGTGKIGPNAPSDDMVEIGLFGLLAGLLALMSVAVLFVTSEYRRGVIRTTFTAAPQRGRTLAAKAAVIGATAFVVALVGGTLALLITRPVLQDHGFAPPAFPPYSLTDGPVVRTLVLGSLFVALFAVFGLGLGTVLRHSASAISIAVMLVVLPIILGAVLPQTAARWLVMLTPAGGLATWRAKPPTDHLAEPWAFLSPWAGLAVAGVYAAVAVGLAWWLLRRRDA